METLGERVAREWYPGLLARDKWAAASPAHKLAEIVDRLASEPPLKPRSSEDGGGFCPSPVPAPPSPVAPRAESIRAAAEACAECVVNGAPEDCTEEEIAADFERLLTSHLAAGSKWTDAPNAVGWWWRRIHYGHGPADEAVRVNIVQGEPWADFGGEKIEWSGRSPSRKGSEESMERSELLNLIREAKDALNLCLSPPDTRSVGPAPLLFIEAVRDRLNAIATPAPSPPGEGEELRDLAFSLLVPASLLHMDRDRPMRKIDLEWSVLRIVEALSRARSEQKRRDEGRKR
jgi:hypothetical protein